VRQHTWVPSAVAKVLLSLAGLVGYIKSDNIPGIDTSRTVDTLWQYPEHNTDSHVCSPKLLSSQCCLSLIFSPTPYPYSQSLELGKATEGVGPVALEGVCLQVSAKRTSLALCSRKTLSFHACILLN